MMLQIQLTPQMEAEIASAAERKGLELLPTLCKY